MAHTIRSIRSVSNRRSGRGRTTHCRTRTLLTEQSWNLAWVLTFVGMTPKGGRRLPHHGRHPGVRRDPRKHPLAGRWKLHNLLIRTRRMRIRQARKTKIKQMVHNAFQPPLRTRATSWATCSGGVCGTIPCPRLKMNLLSRMRSRISSTRSSRWRPPATSSSGSRLP